LDSGRCLKTSVGCAGMPNLGLAAVLAAAVAPGAAAAAARNSTTGKPHIVLVLVDDWGWDNAGYHRPNDPEVATPTIDRLVREGIELDRHYTYHYCSPSRSTLQSGRLSVHVAYGFDDPLLRSNVDPDSGFSGIPRNMTGLAEKMRAGGYRTHMTGKWDAGMATWDHTPMGRGFETFFGYYHHAVDYYTEHVADSSSKPDICGNLVDLWNTTGPARTRNGTAYLEEMFTENTMGILDRHNPAEPLFLFHAFHLVHTPFQVPEEWERPFLFIRNVQRRKYAAMVHYMDAVVGKIVKKLEDKGMWDRTLMVVSSDNGGPTYHFPWSGPAGARNAPLKGGKFSDWEGGVRVNAFAAGGAIPAARRGTKLEDFIHMADWYATFSRLAGVDPADARAAAAGLPPVDGVDQGALLLGGAAPGTGRRSEIHLSARALLSGRWKFIAGGMTAVEMGHDPHAPLGDRWVPFSDYLPGYDIPPEVLRNLTDCHKGCLYDIFADPFEANEVAMEQPEVLARLKARLAELNKQVFLPDRGVADPAGCTRWNGFYGPWIDMSSEPQPPARPRAEHAIVV